MTTTGRLDMQDARSTRFTPHATSAVDDHVRRRLRGPRGVMLELVDVEKSYGDRYALRGVSLTIDSGQVLCLLGRNGAGKTTLVGTACGLLKPDRGVAYVDGLDVRRPRVAQQHIGYAPQDVAVYPTVTTRANLEFFARTRSAGRAHARREVARIVEQFDLGPLLDRKPAQFSGGERRRLSTAVAFVGEPALLLLDEPTAGVDVDTRAMIVEAVRESADAGSAVCYSTHYLAEAEQLPGAIAILDEGRLLAHDSLTRLVDAHGKSAVELTFDGPAPALSGWLAAPGDNATTLRLECDPAEADNIAGSAVHNLAGTQPTLIGVQLVRPSLEAVFLHLTRQGAAVGRRADASTPGREQ